MIPRLPVPALLVLVLFTLGALAGARPPDPGWIGGFYDAADGNDVVLAVVDVEPHAIGLGPVALPTRQAERPFALTAPAVRAPPPA